MKIFISVLTAFLMAISISVNGQTLKETEVPKAVLKSFRLKYPDVYVYEWEWKKKKKVYEAEFIMRGDEYEAYFLPDGQWVRTERDIKRHDVPQAVLESLFNSEYEHWKIDDIEEHSTPEHDILYEIEVKRKKPKQKVYLYFLPDGKLVEVIRKK